MADVVRWNAYELATAVSHQVFLKGSWFDPWAEVEHLHCTRATWACAPGVGTAELVWRYGQGMRPGENVPGVVYRQTPKQKFYVKIVIDENTVPGHPLDDLVWYGILHVDVDQLAGTRLAQGPAGVIEAIASGQQRFTCYGLEQLLDLHHVTTSQWIKSATLETFTLDEGLTFNERGIANRSLLPVDGGFYNFHDDLTTGQHWSTFDAVRYLLKYNTPRDWAGDVRIPFALSDLADALPTWDRPVLPTHGRSTRSLLNQLMPRQRLLSYYVTLAEGGGLGGGDEIWIRPFTFAAADVAVDFGGEVLKANPSQKILAFERDPTVTATVKRSSLDAIERIVITGAKRRNCFTIAKADDTFAEKFSSTIAGEYDAGASTAGDYPGAAEIEDRQRRDADARKSDRLATAYRRFGIVSDWDGLVGDGTGTVDPKIPAAPRDDNPGLSYPLYPPQLKLLDTLPILERHDYDEDKIPDAITLEGDSPFAEIPPIVLVNLPEDTDKYQYVEKVGAAAQLEDTADEDSNRRWSASVKVIPDSLDFEIRVSGQPQHIIAKNHFTPLTDDEEEGTYDYDDFLITLAIECGRRCLASYPEILPLTDAIRTLYLDAGDGYKLDYVAPGTVVGLDPTTQEPLRSDNGGFVRDDRPALARAARLAYAWYSQTRKSLTLSSLRISKGIWLGDLILSTGDPALPVPGDVHVEQINSCVTDITVEIPLAQGLEPGLPSIQWTTAFGELDPLHFAAPRRFAPRRAGRGSRRGGTFL